MERKVGEIFECNGKHYCVQAKHGCTGCGFDYTDCSAWIAIRGKCSPGRSDHTSVIFKEVEPAQTTNRKETKMKDNKKYKMTASYMDFLVSQVIIPNSNTRKDVSAYISNVVNNGMAGVLPHGLHFKFVDCIPFLVPGDADLEDSEDVHFGKEWMRGLTIQDRGCVISVVDEYLYRLRAAYEWPRAQWPCVYWDKQHNELAVTTVAAEVEYSKQRRRQYEEKVTLQKKILKEVAHLPDTVIDEFVRQAKLGGELKVSGLGEAYMPTIIRCLSELRAFFKEN